MLNPFHREAVLTRYLSKPVIHLYPSRPWPERAGFEQQRVRILMIEIEAGMRVEQIVHEQRHVPGVEGHAGAGGERVGGGIGNQRRIVGFG